MDASLPYAHEFADKVSELLQDVVGSGAAPPVPAFLKMAHQRGIALVDTARTTFLIDQRVYHSALDRGHAWRMIATSYLQPRLPAPDVWNLVTNR